MEATDLSLAERLSIAAHRRRTPNREGLRGIHFDQEHGRWRAEIQFRRRRYKLGRFRSPEAAANSYDDAARKYFGEHAIINRAEKRNP